MCQSPMKVYACPSRYVQGKGAFSQLGKEITGLGLKGKALIVVSKTAETLSRELWEPSLQSSCIDYCIYPFSGECSERQIDEIKSAALNSEASFCIAIGGGKALDATRAAAELLHLETVICPSIASTDAPCIALSLIYTETGEMTEFRLHRKNPVLVLVDLELIAKAPKRFLVAGMGDALATYYEARACKKTQSLNPRGGLQTEAGLCLSKLCRDILLADGVHVVKCFESGSITPAFERIVEANVLLSGLGVELCHVAGAHAIHNGLTQLKETHSAYHGEKVAFGLITQLILEGESLDEIHRLLNFYAQVGLPRTFSQIGLQSPSKEDLLRVAKRATLEGETMSHEPVSVSQNDLVDALRYADSLGSKY